MTPKQKAKKLFNKMDMVVGGGNYDSKEYALIAVDEIISINKLQDIESQNYWQEVKKEINKL